MSQTRSEMIKQISDAVHRVGDHGRSTTRGVYDCGADHLRRARLRRFPESSARRAAQSAIYAYAQSRFESGPGSSAEPVLLAHSI